MTQRRFANNDWYSFETHGRTVPKAPRRKDDDAEPITLPALMLATGPSEEENDRLARTPFGEPA